MIPWLGVIKVFLGLAEAFTNYARDRQLLTAGQAVEASNAFGESFRRVAAANAARAGVRHDGDSVRDDPANRDGH